MPTVAEVLQGVNLTEPCTGNATFDVQVKCLNGVWVGQVVVAEETVSPGLLPAAPCKGKDTEAKCELLGKLAEKWTPAEVNELARTLFPR